MARKRGATSSASTAPMLDRVWQSMRILRRFDTADLVATAEAGRSGVEKYVRALGAAGFLRLIEARVNGRPGSRDQWALVRDTGPLAPIVRREKSRTVYDANTRATWGDRGQVVRDAPPPPPPRLAQAAREALRQLATHGTAKLSGETLSVLLRGGLVVITLSEAGRQAAAAVRGAHSQRDGAGDVQLGQQEASHA